MLRGVCMARMGGGINRGKGKGDVREIGKSGMRGYEGIYGGVKRANLLKHYVYAAM